jgi:hypothetical protein
MLRVRDRWVPASVHRTPGTCQFLRAPRVLTDTVQAHVIASVLSQKRTARSAGVYLGCILIAYTDTAHG